MKVLIEQGVFSEDEEVRTVEALRKLKIDHSLWSGKESRPPYEKDNKVFFYGSCITARNLQLCKYPFQIWIDNKFDYSYFHPRLNNLLNEEIVILPYGSAVRQTGGADDESSEPLWIRSNSGLKLWGGGVFTQKEFLNEKPLFPEDLLVFSDPKELGPEYRCVIHKDDNDVFSIVTNSKYIGDGEDSLTVDEEDFVLKVLQSSDYAPFPMFTLDVTRTSAGPKIIEPNSLNCSGLYNCDLEKVFSTLKEVIKTNVL